MKKITHSFTIKRSEWIRGCALESSLLREDGKKCCVGFYSLSCGIPNQDILGYDVLWRQMTRDYPEIAWMWEDFEGESIAAHLYATNDSRLLTEEQREQKVACLFASAGISVTFED